MNYNGDTPKYQQVSLMGSYSLSKSTTLYAMGAFQQAGGSAILYLHHEVTGKPGNRKGRNEERQMMRRVTVRRSPVHGRGVFALRALAAGERIFEYKGEVIRWRTAIRQSRRRIDPGHTYLFGLSDGRVIDGTRGGNSVRWLNHACEANCEAIEIGDRVFIHATTSVPEGAELFLDYQLAVDAPDDAEVRLQYRCRCGSRRCCGTMPGDS